MTFRTFAKLTLAILLAGLIAPLLLPRTPADALKDPCALDPNNLIQNGSMGPAHDTQYGSLADQWEPFIFDGNAPSFRWVGNEQIDPNGSQQIVSSSTFDAGVYQTVRNLQTGVYYWFRLGYSLAAKSYSGPNVRVDSIGRKVGVDPFGGTDPKSPNVIWGPDLFDGNAALNRPEMTMTFAARSSNATIFLRAIARDGSGGENRVWLDAVCMEAKPEMATATPPPATPTSLPPTPTTRPPTSTPRPAIVRAPNTPTKPAVPAAPGSTPTLAVAMAVKGTPEPDAPPEGDAASPRYARPDVTPEAGLLIDPGTGLAVGAGLFLVLGAFAFFAVGLVWWLKMSRGA